MNLTKRQRFEIIPKLKGKIIEMGETDGFFFLEEYIRDKDSLYGMLLSILKRESLFLKNTDFYFLRIKKRWSWYGMEKLEK